MEQTSGRKAQRAGARATKREAGIAAEAASAAADAGRSPESSLSRLLATLGLFSTARPSLMADEIAAELGVPQSTAYRYIQELTKVGLLVRLDRSITLGPPHHRTGPLHPGIRSGDPRRGAADARTGGADGAGRFPVQALRPFHHHGAHGIP